MGGNLSFLYASTGTVAAGGPFFYGSLLLYKKKSQLGFAQDPQKGQAPLELHIKNHGPANACWTTFFCEKAFPRPFPKGSWSVVLF
ncbi:MAG: hypothetical protein HRT88_12910 [Lentisphaeraceae bacterium]|nr:hypothetical protein [Lentisphaeraceae bacterium]